MASPPLPTAQAPLPTTSQHALTPTITSRATTMASPPLPTAQTHSATTSQHARPKPATSTMRFDPITRATCIEPWKLDQRYNPGLTVPGCITLKQALARIGEVHDVEKSLAVDKPRPHPLSQANLFQRHSYEFRSSDFQPAYRALFERGAEPSFTDAVRGRPKHESLEQPLASSSGEFIKGRVNKFCLAGPARDSPSKPLSAASLRYLDRQPHQISERAREFLAQVVNQELPPEISKQQRLFFADEVGHLPAFQAQRLWLQHVVDQLAVQPSIELNQPPDPKSGEATSKPAPVVDRFTEQLPAEQSSDQAPTEPSVQIKSPDAECLQRVAKLALNEYNRAQTPNPFDSMNQPVIQTLIQDTKHTIDKSPSQHQPLIAQSIDQTTTSLGAQQSAQPPKQLLDTSTIKQPSDKPKPVMKKPPKQDTNTQMSRKSAEPSEQSLNTPNINQSANQLKPIMQPPEHRTTSRVYLDLAMSSKQSFHALIVDEAMNHSKPVIQSPEQDTTSEVLHNSIQPLKQAQHTSNVVAPTSELKPVMQPPKQHTTSQVLHNSALPQKQFLNTSNVAATINQTESAMQQAADQNLNPYTAPFPSQHSNLDFYPRFGSFAVNQQASAPPIQALNQGFMPFASGNLAQASRPSFEPRAPQMGEGQNIAGPASVLQHQQPGPVGQDSATVSESAQPRPSIPAVDQNMVHPTGQVSDSYLPQPVTIHQNMGHFASLYNSQPIEQTVVSPAIRYASPYTDQPTNQLKRPKLVASPLVPGEEVAPDRAQKQPRLEPAASFENKDKKSGSNARGTSLIHHGTWTPVFSEEQAAMVFSEEQAAMNAGRNASNVPVAAVHPQASKTPALRPAVPRANDVYNVESARDAPQNPGASGDAIGSYKTYQVNDPNYPPELHALRARLRAGDADASRVSVEFQISGAASAQAAARPEMPQFDSRGGMVQWPNNATGSQPQDSNTNESIDDNESVSDYGESTEDMLPKGESRQHTSGNAANQQDQEQESVEETPAGAKKGKKKRNRAKGKDPAMNTFGLDFEPATLISHLHAPTFKQRIATDPAAYRRRLMTRVRGRSLKPDDFFARICEYAEVAMELFTYIDIKSLFELYCSSRDVHALMNGHLSHICKRYVEARAPESARIFFFNLYHNLCVPDPVGRLLEGTSIVRMVPSLKWLQMVMYRERGVRDILALLARENLRCPKYMPLTLKKMWLTMDIGSNVGRAKLLMMNEYWTDQDIWNAALFFLRLDMRFNDPVDGPGNDGMRKLMLGQRGLGALRDLLARKRFVTTKEILQAGLRYSYKMNPKFRKLRLSVMDVPFEEIGVGHLEGWGEGEIHLWRMDELIPREATRRNLQFERILVNMFLWGFVDPVTRQTIDPSAEEMYMSDSEDERRQAKENKAGWLAMRKEQEAETGTDDEWETDSDSFNDMELGSDRYYSEGECEDVEMEGAPETSPVVRSRKEGKGEVRLPGAKRFNGFTM